MYEKELELLNNSIDLMDSKDWDKLYDAAFNSNISIDNIHIILSDEDVNINYTDLNDRIKQRIYELDPTHSKYIKWLTDIFNSGTIFKDFKKFIDKSTLEITEVNKDNYIKLLLMGYDGSLFYVDMYNKLQLCTPGHEIDIDPINTFSSIRQLIGINGWFDDISIAIRLYNKLNDVFKNISDKNFIKRKNKLIISIVQSFQDLIQYNWGIKDQELESILTYNIEEYILPVLGINEYSSIDLTKLVKVGIDVSHEWQDGSLLKLLFQHKL